MCSCQADEASCELLCAVAPDAQEKVAVRNWYRFNRRLHLLPDVIKTWAGRKRIKFPGRKVRVGIEPASCVEGNGSIPSMPPPEDVTRNQVMRTVMVPSTTKQFNDLLRSMLIVRSARTRRLGYHSAPQKEMYNNI